MDFDYNLHIDDMNLFNRCIDNGTFVFIPEIYDFFQKEYIKSRPGPYWKGFIFNKDIGVVPCVSHSNEKMYKHSIHSDYYYIIDKQKWLLSKLKYGI